MSGKRSRYVVGDRVRVRRAGEIAATLDEDGSLDGLPFMPEMTRFCGATFVVRASAHKTCAHGHGVRAMDSAVLFAGSRCEGSAHGGCQAACPLFWKDAWLEPASAPWSLEAPDGRALLEAKAARSVDGGNGTFRCQTTALHDATAPLPFWEPRQYWDDVRSGNVPARELLRGLSPLVANKLRGFAGRPPRPRIHGTLARTPDVRTGIEPGELVEIRSRDDIVGTLDTAGRNRGLAFDLDMVPFCGRRGVVERRVDTIVDEHSGELRRLRNPCLVLDGVACQGHYHRFCPRAVDCYWREAWLRREEEPS